VAVFRTTQKLDLTPEQKQWLGYIHQHLVANLSIDREDFDIVPVLSDQGGWGRANRVFAGLLPVLIETLNKELVAA
jgi:type I restriction enzyme R subunit